MRKQKRSNESESKIRTELKNYQQKTFEAFETLEPKLKVKLELPHDITQQKIFLDTFLSKAKEDKTPIEKRIMTMKRLPLVVRENGIAIRKDFLEINSQLYSKDWKGDDLWIREYIEGYHYEPEFSTTTKQDPDTGDLIATKQHQGNKKLHDIELTDKNRKQIIEDIINDAHGTYRDEIKFYYEVPNSGNAMAFRCGIYTYDQFINCSLDEMERLARTTPSHLDHSKKDMKGYHG